MPLPPIECERELLHTRTIQCRGYMRTDGLWEIDGWLTDIKTYSFGNRDRGKVKAGEPLHGMGIRLTIDDTMTIKNAVAVTDFSPFTLCGDITPNFQRLIGLRIVSGFNEKVREVLGGVEGCTHLVDLLRPVATTAFQTMVSRRFEKAHKEGGLSTMKRPPILDTCHAWASDGPIVAREFPQFFKGENAESD